LTLRLGKKAICGWKLFRVDVGLRLDGDNHKSILIFAAVLTVA